MFWYFFLLVMICVDFSVEHILETKGVLNGNTNFKKALNFIFKYRLITILTMIFMSTFKAFSVGGDMSEYYKYYNLLKQDGNLFRLPITNKIEFGYTFLCSLLVLCHAPFAVLWFIISSFVAISLMIFINKVSSNKFMSFILFVALGVFAQSLSALRQIVAMSFLLLAVCRLVDKKWISATLLILAGSLFHISAIVCLVIVPLRFLEPKWWWIVSALAVTIVGSFVFPYALKLVEALTPLDYYTKYYVVLTQYIQKSDLLNTLYSLALIGMFAVMYVSRFKLLKFEEQDKKLYDFFLWIFLFVALFRIAGFIVNMPQLFNRLNMYFFTILIVLIPLFVKGLSYNKKLFMVANVAVYVVAVAYMVYLYGIKNTCGVCPFVFNF